MAFRIPTFNLPVRLWRRPAIVSDPPTLEFDANLAHGRREQIIGSSVDTDLSSYTWVMELLCPKLTDIRGMNDSAQMMDVVEVPAGSGRFYGVCCVDDVAKGFPNEYRIAALWQTGYWFVSNTGNPWDVPPWPVPYP